MKVGTKRKKVIKKTKEERERNFKDRTERKKVKRKRKEKGRE